MTTPAAHGWIRALFLTFALWATFANTQRAAASAPMYRDPMSRCDSHRWTAPIRMRHLVFAQRPDLCRPYLEFEGSWLRDGGPMLGLGASIRAKQGSFYGTLGYEVAATEWLFAGLYGEADRELAGGYALVEVALHTTWAITWALGVGPGVEVQYDGDVGANARLKISLQVPAVAFVIQLVGSSNESWFTIGGQLSL